LGVAGLGVAGLGVAGRGAAIARFPTVHVPCRRQGLLMNTYGRELSSLNNVAGP